jgi:hypothetical protein
LTVTSIDVNTRSVFESGLYWPPAASTPPTARSRIAPIAPPSAGASGNGRFDAYTRRLITNGGSRNVSIAGFGVGGFWSTGCG